jgi:hypothetical protein
VRDSQCRATSNTQTRGLQLHLEELEASAAAEHLHDLLALMYAEAADEGKERRYREDDHDETVRWASGGWEEGEEVVIGQGAARSRGRMSDLLERT